MIFCIFILDEKIFIWFITGADLSCHTIAKMLQYDASLWFSLSKVDPYPYLKKRLIPLFFRIIYNIL